MSSLSTIIVFSFPGNANEFCSSCKLYYMNYFKQLAFVRHQYYFANSALNVIPLSLISEFEINMTLKNC